MQWDVLFWHMHWHRCCPGTLVVAENIFKWVFNYIHWTRSGHCDKLHFMVMLIEGQRGHKSKHATFIRGQKKMERVRQWMSPGILLIKRILWSKKGEGGGETKRDVKRQRRRDRVKNQELQKPDSEISLRETGHTERMNKETQEKVQRRARRIKSC